MAQSMNEAPDPAPPSSRAAAARAAVVAREGASWLGQRRFDEAERCFRAAIALRPDLPEAHVTLGAILGVLGRPAEAVASFRAALELRPASADAHGNLGNALRDLGRLGEAEHHLREALHRRPAYPEAHNNLGAVLRDAGQAAEAEGCFRAALRLRPEFAEAHRNLGQLLNAHGRHAEAVASLRAALQGRPVDAAIWAELGSALRALGRSAEAEPALREALRHDPAFEAARIELGNALHDLGRLDEAEAAFRAALTARSDSPAALLGLGVVAGLLGRFAEAEATLRQALQHQPGLAGAHSALGDVLRNRGRLAEAETALREALRLQPDDPDAQVHLAFTLLQAGRLAEGWRAYEHRGRARAWRGRTRRFAARQWQGEALAGRTLLLHAEQGLGDTLQFCRYAPLIHLDGGRVLLEAPEPLERLLASLPGVTVLRRDAPLPPFDLHCPLMSLPQRFGTTLATIPAAPYLPADPAATSAWRARLAALPPGPRVGLVWAGSPATDADRRRSLPLEALAPLADIERVRFVSLQKGPAASQAPPVGLDLHDPTEALRDFADTAALVGALDLVIGVDTAVVHLAGALGRPVWLLNRFDTCWRWLTNRDDSPWYPTLRMFRQTSPDDWAGPVSAVRDALLRWARAPASCRNGCMTG